LVHYVPQELIARLAWEMLVEKNGMAGAVGSFQLTQIEIL
jgi:hypothetical protein